MEKMLISVIIPIFNSDKYLKQCVDSVLNQTYKNLELILVDDGSTDASPEICDEYACIDKRVKVIHKPNGGNTNARKAGLMAASGSCIAFVDSDDWIDKEMYEQMLLLLMQNDADIVASGCYEEYSHKTVQDINHIRAGVYRGKDLESVFYPVMLYFGIYYQFGILPYLCNKLFKKSVIYDILLSLDERIHNGEDAACLFPCMIKAKCIIVTEECWYHYRIRDDSICRSPDEKFFENISALYNALRESFMASQYSNVLMKQLKQYMMRLTFIGTEMLFGLRYNPPCLFPYEIIEKGSNIILYGAGDIGQTYYKQMKTTKYSEVVLWVDRDYKKYAGSNLPVTNVEKVFEVEYDYIIIAIYDKLVAESIKENLVRMGINESRIIWRRPIVITAADAFAEIDK